VTWSGQGRDGAQAGWREAIRRYGPATLLGGSWALLVHLLTPALLPWLAPVLLGLVVAVPLALLSGSAGLGVAAARRGWFLVPEEIRPPRELAWIGAPAAAAEPVAPALPATAADGGVAA
jgi:membrane glycosyltransferase